ncbi:hypothetical protein G6F62_015589 [Rhizopus arrhizus]|nr:hypothetical protein G6F62_015589 [Rhizopus arrhizus]
MAAGPGVQRRNAPRRARALEEVRRAVRAAGGALQLLRVVPGDHLAGGTRERTAGGGAQRHTGAGNDCGRHRHARRHAVEAAGRRAA